MINKINKKMRLRLSLYLGLASAIFPFPASLRANSSVGNGGDIFSEYLESTRFAIKESLRRLASNPDDAKELCEDEEVDPSQSIECRAFILETLSAVLELNQVAPIPNFLLRNEPLIVEGPDGQPREVDARTPLGRAGDIEINYERVKFFSPFQLMALLTHEFGHKAAFRGRFVDDNSPTGSFPYGRRLLDSVGKSLATYAQRNGTIGREFRLLDHFTCRIRTSSEGVGFRTSGFSVRMFASSRDYRRYESGIGLFPGNLDVALTEPGFSEIHLRSRIHEETGCDASNPAGRWTRLSLIRTFPAAPGEAQRPDQLLVEKTLENWNPLCEPANARHPMEIMYGSYYFECFYSGSSATTSKD